MFYELEPELPPFPMPQYHCILRTIYPYLLLVYKHNYIYQLWVIWD